MLTFSALAYIAILVSLVLILINIQKPAQLMFLVLIPVFSCLAYGFVPGIRLRVNDTFETLIGKKEAKFSNLSTYSLTSNGYVSMKCFQKSPLFGFGLGSHPISYERIIHPGMAGGWYKGDAYGLNKKSAGSMFFRLMSETGLFGLMVVLYFVFGLRIKNINNINMYVLSNSIFTMFILQLIRQGHYFYNGLFFFVWMYYFINRSVIANLIEGKYYDPVNSEV